MGRYFPHCLYELSGASSRVFFHMPYLPFGIEPSRFRPSPSLPFTLACFTMHRLITTTFLRLIAKPVGAVDWTFFLYSLGFAPLFVLNSSPLNGCIGASFRSVAFPRASSSPGPFFYQRFGLWIPPHVVAQTWILASVSSFLPFLPCRFPYFLRG